ncbi:DNA-directed RNA polymerase subunit K [Candidatus Pacearchaeota archaeon CG10_big_fil_rev_8_21_14_0_10_35_219]|nr:DNA-directed RNA polymerase subunit K [Candidatus Pacearchaeota archaeon]OIO43422.1 MAG: hypothetical protein AUJ63_00845 [Candidatus Pacearchaeota archaeon CG1_02_35_32]PIO08066.1 MAG: DNA-directed RNA polymerase subunit K [Candidatus Pacearchaeota archaeon CG10_big_fil_rev_8_21_14_0_10_35_219]PIY81579.1 MAG: DNA-directed RNA polymerase subunit K [Candidatus Pacearchaeota archaeon CG_4_10_14_0_8_um_filter_35_169]PIZ78954.1 MAG: DNA-directed RNA polymerase subunit K [Candidatus Pacearchaeota
MEQEFTKYEITRILGARGLQISMGAPLLMKFSEEELKELKYDALMIAEKEFDSKVLPISVDRPMPEKKSDKLREVKEEKMSDEEIEAKEKEVEKEIEEKAEELGFGPDDEDEEPSESNEEER